MTSLLLFLVRPFSLFLSNAFLLPPYEICDDAEVAVLPLEGMDDDTYDGDVVDGHYDDDVA